MAGNGKVQVQMIGFATLKLTSPNGKVLLIDPWLTGNDFFPDGKFDEAGRPLSAHITPHLEVCEGTPSEDAVDVHGYAEILNLAIDKVLEQEHA